VRPDYSKERPAVQGPSRATRMVEPKTRSKTTGGRRNNHTERNHRMRKATLAVVIALVAVFALGSAACGSTTDELKAEAVAEGKVAEAAAEQSADEDRLGELAAEAGEISAAMETVLTTDGCGAVPAAQTMADNLEAVAAEMGTLNVPAAEYRIRTVKQLSTQLEGDLANVEAYCSGLAAGPTS
jgi:hypothetical protein